MTYHIDKIYRLCVIVTLSSYIAWEFLPYADGAWLGEKEMQVLSYSTYNALIIYPNELALIVVAILIVLSIGIFLFNNLARLFYTILILYILLLTPFDGMSVQTSLEAFILSLYNTSSGMTVAMMYLTSINERFDSA